MRNEDSARKAGKLELKRESVLGQKRSKQAPKVSSAPGGIADTIYPIIRRSFSAAFSRGC